MKGVLKKDYILHVRMVIRAMEEILELEGGDSDILIPAAVLHDVGWSAVPMDLQLAEDKELKREAGMQHIQKAPPIIRKILSGFGWEKNKIERVVGIVLAHKFTDPQEKEKQLLIDADNLSDAYKESFWSDLEFYNSTPREAWEYRSRSQFYTDGARQIFETQMAQRMKEINGEELS